jgi:excisionase family DNA binding protein
MLIEQPEALLTAAEVAAILRVSRRTVYHWASTGEIPSVELGKRTVRFRREDVGRLVTRRHS